MKGETPVSKKVTIRIDGELITTSDANTIFEAARLAGKKIPGLCYMPGLTAVGACRLCIVEVAGVNRLLAACTTSVQDGMAVTTRSPKINGYRRIVLELLFSERNHICAVCVSNGHCGLQSLAMELGVTSVRFAYGYPQLQVDASHERYVLDHNRCILCTRCVRVCAEVEGAHVWNLKSRGIGSRLVCELNQKWAQSASCTSCGKCVQSCPTGALAEKGKAAGEMVKINENVSRLAGRRGAHLWAK